MSLSSFRLVPSLSFQVSLRDEPFPATMPLCCGSGRAVRCPFSNQAEGFFSSGKAEKIRQQYRDVRGSLGCAALVPLILHLLKSFCFLAAGHGSVSRWLCCNHVRPWEAIQSLQQQLQRPKEGRPIIFECLLPRLRFSMHCLHAA